MNESIKKAHWKTIIIGGGQAGLATGYYLKRLGEDFIILDEGARVGDVWRNRWDSLRLFTPSQYNGLPGLSFPSPHGTFPNKDEMANYLEVYAKRFDLPVWQGVRAMRLVKTNEHFNITTPNGTLTSDKVIVATGSNPVPRIPDYAKELDNNIHQIHSSQYRNPDLLPNGDTLVVGAGSSGIEIAIELAKNRCTLIAGDPEPGIVLTYRSKFYWWFAHNIVTTRSQIFYRKAKGYAKGGFPLIRIASSDLDKAGVERLPRVTGVKDGHPLLVNGKRISISNIIWATGYKPDFSWIDSKVTDETGWLKTERGVSGLTKGLYCVGMWFQFALTSALIGGVGRDAEFVANHIKKTTN